MRIEAYEGSMQDAVVELALRAWEPVFESIEASMDPAVFRIFYPDWREVQGKAVRDALQDDANRVWVAIDDERVAGFTASRLHRDDSMGEIYMIAVDPDFQRRGIAAELTQHSLRWFEESGMQVAMVDTGGDPGHAPARRTYESSGFRLLPIARYFKKL